jgi:hypothetical protein
MHFDELRLWGAYPKVMFYTNALPQFSREMFSYNYPPGISLIQYFFLALRKVFRDNTLYLIYYSFYLSLIVPAFARLKKSFLSVFFSSLCAVTFLNIFIPLYYSEAIVYMTLYIDPLLGVLFGYCLVLIAHQEEIGSTAFFQFLLANSFIVLFKESGIVFAGTACIVYIIDLFFLTKHSKTNFTFKKKIARAGIACVFPIAINISWSLFINKMFVDFAAYTSTYLSLSSNLFRLPAYTNLVTQRFINALVVFPIFGGYFSFVGYFLVLFIISVLMYLATKNTRTLLLHIGVFLCCCVYVGFLWYCYLFVFTEEEALRVASITRYLQSACIGVGIYYLYDLLNHFRNHSLSDIKTYAILSILALILPVSLIMNNFKVLADFIAAPGQTVNISYYPEYAAQLSFSEEDIEIIISKIPPGESLKLFYSPGNCDYSMGLSHHLTYYHLLDYQIIVNNYFTTISCLSLKDIKKELSSVNYMYLSHPISDEFNKLFNLYFNVDIKLEQNTVYYVSYDVENFTLVIYPIK